ncbi:MBL fold metallo-hydrolase [Roseomonas sp. HJA6]|uniref:MBL fold metallo-hydrolase n=1 Tax=Roseomonas alba TaxID=2846776 RepID=A0ABS7AC05_9PROT|nr:alkyl sulfatase dimerization domain-containing protein [Neoroseomonas alba]MBW6399302.1 MBL fold metallo-hydrolase [Neoroseomonas alba]
MTGKRDECCDPPRATNVIARRNVLAGSATVAAASVVAAPDPATAQQQTAIAHTFPSPYMNAARTRVVTIAKGAMVSEETAAYWNLPVDSPQRASYDADIVVNVAPGVWTFGTESIVNCHAVAGQDGVIVYDTGDNLKDGEKFYGMLRRATNAPIRAIIYSHEHYVNGAKYFVDEEARRGNTDIKIVGHPNTNESVARTGGLSAAHPEVSTVLYARSVEQFNFYLPEEGPDSRFKNTIVPQAAGFVPVNTPIQDKQELTIAGIRLVFYTGGVGTDTENQTLVWMPDRKIVMNNVIWGMYPNIYSARGGRYRDPGGWIASVEIIKQLKPDILLSTHSTSLAGADQIMQRLQDYQDGLAFVRDQSLKGILLGQGPDELRYSVQMPERLKNSPILVQNYGEVSLMAPRIFNAIFGQFDRNAANLHKLHPTEEAERMIVAMGGAEAVRTKARQAHEDGDYLWAGQLADYLVKTDNSAANRQLKAEALRQMAYRTLSTNTRSWLLSQARELEGKVSIVKSVPAQPAAVETNLADYVNYYRVRVSAERSKDTDMLMTLAFEDGRSFGLHVRRSVVDFVQDVTKARRAADVTVRMKPETWTLVFNNVADPAALIDKGDIGITTGDAARAKAFFALFDAVYDWVNDPALVALGTMLQATTHSRP